MLMDNYYNRVIAKEEEQSALIKRMITDSDLLYLAKYVLRDKMEKAIPDIINVTLNKPAIFAANVIASLGATSEQTVVLSSKTSFDTHYVEEFQEAAFSSANNRLQKRGQTSLNNFSDVQLCIRGRGARRILFRRATEKDVADGIAKEVGEIIPDIISWDTRYVTGERGEDGMKWGAYHINRNWASTESQYGELMVKYGVMKEGEKKEKANILDVWTPDHNEVWIEGAQVLEQKHDYGFCPVVYEVVDLGYGNVLMDETRLQHEGESIFFMIRDVIPELNRLVSLLTTLNQKQLLGSMKNITADIQSEPPDFPKSMEVLNVENDLSPIDYGDARKSAEMVYTILENALQQGSISDIDLGNLNFPMSAVALVTVGEGRDQVYLPRLNAKALLNQRTAEMFTRQILQIGESSIELGTAGHKRSFNTQKLEGEYETTYKYYTKSPKMDIARLTMGDAALKMGVDRETVYTDILQYEDPKGMIQKYYYELAEKLSPKVLMNRTIRKLTEMAEEDGDEDAAEDAYILQVELGASIDQTLTGGQGQIQPPQQQSSDILPLMGQGGKVGGVKPAPAEMPGGV
jgi:hypothetical protein